MKNAYMIGERTYLRPLEPSDAALMQPWVNDPEVARNLSMFRPATLKDELQFIERTAASTTDVALGIVLRDGDRLIGTAGLHQLDWKNRSAGFGIAIGVREEWDKGHGTEVTRMIAKLAFERMNLHRLWLLVYEFNVRGIRCYEHVGFQRDGLLRDYLWVDGRYWNALSMSLLSTEWNPEAR